MDRRLCVLGALMLSASAVLAQDAGPPKVIAIAREEIKPGRGSAHAKSVASFIAAVNRADAPIHRMPLARRFVGGQAGREQAA